MSSEDHEPFSLLQLTCPHCGVGLRIRAQLAGKKGTCPQCRGPLVIPAARVAQRAILTTDEALDETPSVAQDEYALATPLPHATEADTEPLPPPVIAAPAPSDGYLARFADVRQVGSDAPPRWLFYSGVVNFLAYPEIRGRWAWLFGGGCMISLLPVLILSMVENMGGYALMGMAFFVLPEIWLVLWTCSYAATCATVIFDETAGGNDHIADWVTGSWNEWAGYLYYIGYVMFMVAALGYGVVYLCGGTMSARLGGILLAEYILFPVTYLSVLEKNSIAYLLSWPVIRGMLRQTVTVLHFYLLTGALLGVWVGLFWKFGTDNIMVGLLLCGSGFASVSLIYPRLLGRLAWVLTRDLPRKKRRRVQPVAETT